jgi:membrane fusion protein, heavy metal efflux system
MKETIEKQEKVETVNQPNGTASETKVTAKHVSKSPPSRQRKWTVLLVAFVALVGLSLIVWMFWFRTKHTTGNEAGRAVPAPRSISFDSSVPNNEASKENQSEPKLTIAQDQAERAGIRIETVGEQLTSTNQDTAATGVVQANSYRETPVVSVVGGIVRRVNVELGDSVKRGQLMAVVFSEQLSMTQSTYLKALAELDEHHKHHRRTTKLLEIGAASRAELEEATTRLKSGEAEVASMKQKLQLLGLSPQQINRLDSSSEISSEVSVPAPISGTIINRSVNQGEVIEANKEMLRVADLSSVWVIGQIYEKDLGRVRVGSGASITTEAYPGKVFRGRISYVDPHLDPQTRTAQVRIELANPGQMLKIGMYVNVAFATISGSESTVAVIPKAAVQIINNQQVVFMATNEANVFIYRPVRLGPEANGYYSVFEGVQVGDRIVTDGSFMLRAEWLKQHPGT